MKTWPVSIEWAETVNSLIFCTLQKLNCPSYLLWGFLHNRFVWVAVAGGIRNTKRPFSSLLCLNLICCCFCLADVDFIAFTAVYFIDSRHIGLWCFSFGFPNFCFKRLMGLKDMFSNALFLKTTSLLVALFLYFCAQRYSNDKRFEENGP